MKFCLPLGEQSRGTQRIFMKKQLKLIYSSCGNEETKSHSGETAAGAQGNKYEIIVRLKSANEPVTFLEIKYIFFSERKLFVFSQIVYRLLCDKAFVIS